MKSPLNRLVNLAAWQINALGLASCAALAGLWYVAGYTPLAQAGAAREAANQDLTTKRQTIAHLAQTRAARQQSLERIKADLAARSVKLRPLEQSLDQISELSRAAVSVGLTLDEIKPGQPAVRERFTVLPIHLSGGGDYPGVASLLHELRASFPDMAVRGFELKGEPEQSDKPGRFTLDLLWYASKLPAAPAQTDVAPKK